jgi:RNA polymerase sigma-70 factor (ECF subfamily)
MVRPMEGTPVVTEGEAPPALRGDGPADFESFFRAEHDRLYRAMYVVTGSTHEAEELMQDAFLRTWERWDRVATMDDPVGYLFRAAMNAFRSRRRRAVLAIRKMRAPAEGRDAFALADDRDAVARAMRKLSPRQRAALVLTEWLGFGSEEAGDILGVRAATVRALTHQARAALKEHLEDDHE